MPARLTTLSSQMFLEAESLTVDHSRFPAGFAVLSEFIRIYLIYFIAISLYIA